MPGRAWPRVGEKPLAPAASLLLNGPRIMHPEIAEPIQVSVVIPCLNEAETLAECIEKAQRGLAASRLAGEVIVADNGSVDESVAIARRLGARVVDVAEKGYGNALMGGIEAAIGPYIIMGDADASYDFEQIPLFVAQLEAGAELVQGCRLPAGGGTVLPGAMPILHRWLGNPFFSFLARRWFRAPIHDVYCGMRGFRKDLYRRLELRCTGMEFATEMIIKASLNGAKIAEVPITLHPDGRRTRRPHLKTFHDGWRTLRFFLMSSPRWLFLVPGVVMIVLGALGYALSLPNVKFMGIGFDAHTLLFSSLAIIMGYQSVLFAFYTKIYAIGDHLLPEDPRIARMCEILTLERGFLLAMLAFLTGLGRLLYAFNHWRLSGFGELNYSQTMKLVIPGFMLTALGFQTILSGFFISILGMRRR